MFVPLPDWLLLVFFSGTSGEIGMLRPIKIEPEELDIIQVTVSGERHAQRTVGVPVPDQTCWQKLFCSVARCL